MKKPNKLKKQNPHIWVTRNPYIDSKYIELWASQGKPVLLPHPWYTGEVAYEAARGYITEICLKQVERLTGLSLKPGECKKVRFSAKVIE